MTQPLTLSVDLALHGDEGAFSLKAELQVEDICSLIGPSGAGKSSLLRCIAGLPVPVTGEGAKIRRLEVHLGGRCLTDAQTTIPPERRRIGMVFQNSRLFPHLSVEGNLQFAADRSVTSVTSAELADIAHNMGIETLMDRPIGGLSGGEQQRISVARALASKPQLLLLDEPLSALDRQSRNSLLRYLKEWLAHMDIPALMVSHDFKDATQIAHQLIYMEKGQIIAQGKPEDIASRLDLGFTQTEDACAIVSGRVISFDANTRLSEVQVAASCLRTLGLVGEPGQWVRLRIPAQDVGLSKSPISNTSVLNQIKVQLDGLTHQENGTVLVRLAMDGGQFLLARITDYSLKQLALKQGDHLYALIKGIALSGL